MQQQKSEDELGLPERLPERRARAPLALREQQLLLLSRSAVIDAGDLEASLSLIAGAALQGLGVSRVSIWLWDDQRDHLNCVHLQASPSSELLPTPPPLLRSRYPLYFAALDKASVLAADDAQSDPRTAELNGDHLQALGIASRLDTAIRLVGETAGVLCFEHAGTPRRWREEEASYAAALAETAGRAMVAERRQRAERQLRELNQQLGARVARETAEAHRAEQLARAARRQLQDITDHMPGAVFQLLWRSPGDFQLLYISDGITRITGLKAEAFTQVGAPALASIHTEDLHGLLSAIDHSARTPGQPFEYDFRVNHPHNGEELWLQTQSRGSAMLDGGVLFNGSFTDITARKQLEKKIQENERLLKAAIDASSDGIWEWHLLNDAVYYSDAWFRQLGYDAGELPSRLDTFTRLCHPDDIRSAFTAISATVESTQQQGYSAEFRMRTKDGGWRWILARGNVTERDAEGRALRLTGTNVDIDERKQLEQSLAVATRAAQEASKAKGDFLANISHEIRTPMNAVIGLANLLGNTALQPQQRDYLDKLQNASRSLLALINDVLDLSKIEAGKLQIEQAPFNLEAVLDNILLMVGAQASAKGLKLVSNLAPQLPAAFIGDSLRLGQVLSNLIGNAIKFTERGEVSLNVSWQADESDTGMLRFAVRDSGIGIASERVGGLFQSFEQEDSSTSRRYGGTGLGLAICRQLVALMGGDIWVESTLGRGSTFSFTLPLRSTAAPVQIASVPEQTDSLLGLRVLVAEDNDINLEILTELLSRVGIEVRAARDGFEAVAGCIDGWPELVLMDMQMPDIDGLAATTMLRADPRFADLPIIALTANAMSEDRARCLAAGMNDHLAKPIDVEQLYAVLGRWIPK